MDTRRSPNRPHDSRDYGWVGSSNTEKISVTSSELEESIELRQEWRDQIEIDHWETEGWKAARISPKAEDARNNSELSGDHNILHKEADVVEEVSKYSFVREVEQEGEVVVSQGMSFVDALASRFEKPVESIQGSWTKMVYAPEGAQNPDSVVLSDNGSKGFRAVLFPGGKTDKAMEAGRVSLEYAENSEEYHPEHNIYMTALADQAVGRGFKTPDDVRNGELLVENSITSNKPVDWEEAEEFTFKLKEVDREDSPQVEARWDIDVRYGEEVANSALSYTEKSMYIDGFEELESVKELYGGSTSVFDPYIQATATTATMALTPLRISAVTLNSLNRGSR